MGRGRQIEGWQEKGWPRYRNSHRALLGEDVHRLCPGARHIRVTSTFSSLPRASLPASLTLQSAPADAYRAKSALPLLPSVRHPRLVHSLFHRFFSQPEPEHPRSALLSLFSIFVSRETSAARGDLWKEIEARERRCHFFLGYEGSK